MTVRHTAEQRAQAMLANEDGYYRIADRRRATEHVHAIARDVLALTAEVEQLREVAALAEQAFDNIARLAEMNAEEPGWQVEVHRIACEGWRQIKDARAVLGDGEQHG